MCLEEASARLLITYWDSNHTSRARPELTHRRSGHRRYRGAAALTGTPAGRARPARRPVASRVARHVDSRPICGAWSARQAREPSRPSSFDAPVKPVTLTFGTALAHRCAIGSLKIVLFQQRNKFAAPCRNNTFGPFTELVSWKIVTLQAMPDSLDFRIFRGGEAAGRGAGGGQ